MFGFVLVSVIIVGIVKLVAGVCPDGWQRHEQSCYHFSHDREEWPGAYKLCELMGGQLVEIEDTYENFYLAQQVKNLGHSWWIGLSDVSQEGIWVWMTSGTKVNGKFSNWAPNEPSTFDDNHEPENCANFYSTGVWNDSHCTQFNYYICEKYDGENEIVG